MRESKKKNSYLSEPEKSEIEQLAEAVADSYSIGLPVNPEQIAKAENITYSYGDYADAFDGLLEHEYGNFHIYVNTNRLRHPYTERARFTFAHELGHFFMDNHRVALAKGLAQSHGSFTGFVSNLKMEREADYFAACLLMPRNRILKDYQQRKFEFVLIQEISKKYQTSITASALRYAVIGCHPIMVVSSQKNKINWYWFTNDFPFKKLKHSKAKIPENTAAWEFLNDGIEYKSAEEVFSQDWFEIGYDSEIDRRFYEYTIPGYNNSALSIIWED